MRLPDRRGCVIGAPSPVRRPIGKDSEGAMGQAGGDFQTSICQAVIRRFDVPQATVQQPDNEQRDDRERADMQPGRQQKRQV
jgi:hypothetical protein